MSHLTQSPITNIQYIHTYSRVMLSVLSPRPPSFCLQINIIIANRLVLKLLSTVEVGYVALLWPYMAFRSTNMIDHGHIRVRSKFVLNEKLTQSWNSASRMKFHTLDKNTCMLTYIYFKLFDLQGYKAQSPINTSYVTVTNKKADKTSKK